MIYPAPKPKSKKRVRVSLKHGKLLKRVRIKAVNRKRGGHAFPKNVDEPYREWIRALPCLLWHADGDTIDAAHIKTRGSGGLDRNNLIPLCRTHHTEQHAIGIQSFQRRHSVNLRLRARELTALYDAEKFPCP